MHWYHWLLLDKEGTMMVVGRVIVASLPLWIGVVIRAVWILTAVFPLMVAAGMLRALRQRIELIVNIIARVSVIVVVVGLIVVGLIVVGLIVVGLVVVGLVVAMILQTEDVLFIAKVLHQLTQCGRRNIVVVLAEKLNLHVCIKHSKGNILECIVGEFVVVVRAGDVHGFEAHRLKSRDQTRCAESSGLALSGQFLHALEDEVARASGKINRNKAVQSRIETVQVEIGVNGNCVVLHAPLRLGAITQSLGEVLPIVAVCKVVLLREFAEACNEVEEDLTIRAIEERQVARLLFRVVIRSFVDIEFGGTEFRRFKGA